MMVYDNLTTIFPPLQSRASRAAAARACAPPVPIGSAVEAGPTPTIIMIIDSD